MSLKSLILGAAMALSLGAAGAQAATITFGNPGLSVLAGPVTEAGFTYSTASGVLLFNSYGNPDGDMEGAGDDGGGVLKIVAADASLFTFQLLDYAAYGSSGSQTLTLSGWLNGAEVGSESFLLGNSSAFSSGTYENWTLFGAEGLDGIKIDTLYINLNGSRVPFSFQAVDNITLGVTSAIPEPATWALMITGFGLAGAALRRRRNTAVAA